MKNNRLSQPREPWTGEDGSELSGYALKRKAANWGGEDWDRYLAYLDFEETGTRELLISPASCRHISEEEYKKNFSDLIKKEKYDHLAGQVDYALEFLTENQRHIVKSHFWEEKTFIAIAIETGREESTVRRNFEAGIKKLKAVFDEILVGQKPKKRRLRKKIS